MRTKASQLTTYAEQWGILPFIKASWIYTPPTHTHPGGGWADCHLYPHPMKTARREGGSGIFQRPSGSSGGGNLRIWERGERREERPSLRVKCRLCFPDRFNLQNACIPRGVCSQRQAPDKEESRRFFSSGLSLLLPTCFGSRASLFIF